MKLVKNIFFVFLAIIVFGYGLEMYDSLGIIEYAKADYEVVEEQPTTQDLIRLYAKEYGSDPEMLYDVLMHESGGNAYAVGDGGRAKSYFQYFDETWNRYVKRYNQTFGSNEKFDRYSIHDNIKLTAWVFSLSDTERNEWTTYRCLKNGGKYTFYSRIHKKKMTITCDANKYNL
jgi:soluble lytic murein transglycosylase-like protein